MLGLEGEAVPPVGGAGLVGAELDDVTEVGHRANGPSSTARVTIQVDNFRAPGISPARNSRPAVCLSTPVAYSNDNTDGVTGLCLEINDFWLTKLSAGRPKDFEFCRALVRARLITPEPILRFWGKSWPASHLAQLISLIASLLAGYAVAVTIERRSVAGLPL